MLDYFQFVGLDGWRATVGVGLVRSEPNEFG
jgi:hypothetical protein